ncbi:MAG: 50S ribosomal protein L9 [Anaerolineae bacterium]|nr:50S ribosomal protein L9 [Anaerolineae bacterium]
MKLLLLSDVYKQGVAGEVVDVADGYGRNYLIPKKLAVKATPGELKKAEGLRATAAARKAELEDRLNDLARQIDGVELVFGRRAANTGKLFGSVTTSDLAEALNKKTGIDINRRRISQQALREIGTFNVPVRLGSEMSPTLKVVVVREADLADYLAGKTAAPPVVAMDDTGDNASDIDTEAASADVEAAAETATE